MKMRILENSLRFRLNQLEIQQFAEKGSVACCLAFGDERHQQLHYVIARDEAAQEVFADYIDHAITIHVPPALAREWVETDRVGFETLQSRKNNQETLKILVEKDFQCLKPREGKEDAHGFPHPLADQETC